MSNKNKWVIPIYVLAMIFFIYKMMFYTNYVGKFPDEPCHISYVAYLEKTNKIIPEFKDMTQIKRVNSDKSQNDAFTIRNKYGGTYVLGPSFNYLGHPPLYYQILRLSGGISVNKDGTMVIRLFQLRLFSIVLASLAMLLVFYIGFSRLGNNPFFHLLYASVSISVPMLAYDCAGINNDTMSFLTVTIFTLGLLRFAEKKRNYGTYLLIGLGVFGAFMSKLTAGAITLAALGFYVIYLIFKERNLKFLLTPQFLSSLPFYFATAAYYLYIKHQTGSFQPSFAKLCPEQFYSSGFYVAPQNRRVMNLPQYAYYFFNHFVQTWVSIQSHVALTKAVPYYDISTIGIVAILILPIFIYFKRYSRKPENPILPVVGTMYPAVVALIFLQFYHAYKDFKYGSGYLGGFQSRYYLCCIAALALGTVWVFKKLYGREKARPRSLSRKSRAALKTRELRHTIVNFACVAYSALLIYEDFIYFVLHFDKYLK